MHLGFDKFECQCNHDTLQCFHHLEKLPHIPSHTQVPPSLLKWLPSGFFPVSSLSPKQPPFLAHLWQPLFPLCLGLLNSSGVNQNQILYSKWSTQNAWGGQGASSLCLVGWEGIWDQTTHFDHLVLWQNSTSSKSSQPSLTDIKVQSSHRVILGHCSLNCIAYLIFLFVIQQ
jgi:hypothetical protein